MNHINEFVPIVPKNAVQFGHFISDGSFKFVSKAHPELNYITINRTAKEMLDLCLGDKNMDQIVETLFEKYDANKDILFNDLYQTLKKLWRFGVVQWKNNDNPFQEEFSKQNNGYIVNLLSEKEILDSIKNINANFIESIYFNAYAFKNVEFTESFIKNSWINNSRLYYRVVHNDIHYVVALSKNITLEAYDVIFIVQENGDSFININAEIVFKLLSNLCNALHSSSEKQNRFYFSSDNSGNMFLNQTAIKKNGILKNENNIIDYHIYSIVC